MNNIQLFNADGVKIGETFPRRAKQLVKQQRGVWTDWTETAVRFYPGMENMDVKDEDPTDNAPVPNARPTVQSFVQSTPVMAQPVASPPPMHQQQGHLPAEQEAQLHINDLCFALWQTDGMYYPAVISDVTPLEVYVAYLDGTNGRVPHNEICTVKYAFENLKFQGRYGWLGFYNGRLLSTSPIVLMYDDDGITEQKSLRDLRGSLR